MMFWKNENKDLDEKYGKIKMAIEFRTGDNIIRTYPNQHVHPLEYLLGLCYLENYLPTLGSLGALSTNEVVWWSDRAKELREAGDMRATNKAYTELLEKRNSLVKKTELGNEFQ